jgi:solute carrier family 35 protein
MNQKVGSALAYGGVSILIMLVNRVLLYTYQFPSIHFLSLCQYMSSLILLILFDHIGWVELNYQYNHLDLAVMNVANGFFGLYGSKALSIPMFTVLRRSSLILTMGLEAYFFKKKYSNPVIWSVSFIIFGSLIAALNDLDYDLIGYIMVWMNNICTSVVGVLIKQQVDQENPLDILFTNALVGTMLMLVTLPWWYVPVEMNGLVLISSLLAGLLQFTILYCTKYNSALTTSVIGVMKNVVTTYVGMIWLGYTFDPMNFIGINLSLFGGILYIIKQTHQ